MGNPWEDSVPNPGQPRTGQSTSQPAEGGGRGEGGGGDAERGDGNKEATLLIIPRLSKKVPAHTYAHTRTRDHTDWPALPDWIFRVRTGSKGLAGGGGANSATGVLPPLIILCNRSVLRTSHVHFIQRLDLLFSCTRCCCPSSRQCTLYLFHGTFGRHPPSIAN